MMTTAVRRAVARRWHWLVGGVMAGRFVSLLSPHIPDAMAWLGERPVPLVVVLPALVLLWPLAIGEALAEWKAAPSLLAALGTILVGMCCWCSTRGLLRAMTTFARAAAALILLRWMMWTFHPESVRGLSREQALEWRRWQKLHRFPLGGVLLTIIWGGKRAIQTLDRLADDQLLEVRV